MQWYYAVGDQRQGPVEQAEFERLVAAGTIRAETLVWRQGMTDWKTYAAVSGAAPGVPPVDDGTEVCAVSGKRYPRREMVSYEGKWISAEHRDAFFQRMRDGISAPVPKDGRVRQDAPEVGSLGYGGFGRRFAARLIDGVVQTLVGLLVSTVVGVAFGAAGMLSGGNIASIVLMQVIIQGFSVLFALSYEVFFVRKYDATPGKMALGLKILRPDGAKLSIGRIIGRYFATIVSAIPLGIGYIMAAFDDEARALHDRMADTRVFRTK